MTGLFKKTVTRRELALGTGAALVGALAPGVNAASETAQTKMFELVSLKDYMSVQDAFNAVATGGRILVNDGEVFNVNGDTLTISKSVRMVGGGTLKLNPTTVSKSLMNLTGASTVVIFDGPTLDLNQPTADGWTNIAISANGVAAVELRSGCITNSAASAFPAANNGYGCYLQGEYGKVVVHPGFKFEKHRYALITHPSSTGRQVKVMGGEFLELAGDGVEINVPSGTCDDVVLMSSSFRNIGSNNAGRGFGFGASGAVRRVRISLNDFEAVDNQSIHIEDGCEDVVIGPNTHNNIGYAAAATYGCAVYCAASTTAIGGVKIHQQTIDGVAATDYGIYCGGSVASGPLEVVDNTVRNIGNGNGIMVGSAWTRAEVDRNKVKNSKGVGIVFDPLSGSLVGNRCWDDQGTKTQTYGIELKSNSREADIRENNQSGNINKGYLLTALTFPKKIASEYRRDTAVAAGAGAYSTWTDAFYLGLAASGTVYVNWVRGSDRSTGMFTISWDGSTLTGTKLAIQSSGNLAISSTFASALRATAGWLQAEVFNSGGAVSDIVMEVAFDGLVLVK